MTDERAAEEAEIDRRTVAATAALLVEWVRCRLGRRGTPETYSPDRQVLLTRSGRFRWKVGRASQIVDANRAMFVERREVSRDLDAGCGEVTCLLVTPSAATAEALWPAGPADPFRLRTALASSALQAALARLPLGSAREPAEWEEAALHLIGRATADALAARPPVPAAAARLARRAKERLSPAGAIVPLTAVARDLGVSPAYLTDAFRRAEGISLVRYQMKLRLMKALVELPHASCVTRLALDLGFSSHSHFSTAFRAAIGQTPSQYRREARAIERS
ncbi:MAG TPA: helix-turn-helix transcriptional regulator [Kofleriaceae bacterium]|nr:helix-turn-helix transcriptional regulator [Kofleriaceae bacterium]